MLSAEWRPAHGPMLSAGWLPVPGPMTGQTCLGWVSAGSGGSGDGSDEHVAETLRRLGHD